MLLLFIIAVAVDLDVFVVAIDILAAPACCHLVLACCHVVLACCHIVLACCHVVLACCWWFCHPWVVVDIAVIASSVVVAYFVVHITHFKNILSLSTICIPCLYLSCVLYLRYDDTDAAMVWTQLKAVPGARFGCNSQLPGEAPFYIQV